VTTGKTIKPQPRRPNSQGNGRVRSNQVIDPDILEVDLNHLTIAEIEDIEEITGKPIDSLQDPTVPKGKTLRAIAYVIGKRTNPEYTLEEAGKKRVMFDVSQVPPTSDGISTMSSP
jgi:hypothetical protein